MIYDRDYFENGLITGKSGYENYRWIPELTIPLAMTIIDYVDIKRGDTVLDFGCAKGYLVKAMRWLGREAYGCDISEYAVDHADAEVKDYITRYLPTMEFSCCIAKDVFEHMERDVLSHTLKNINAKFLFAIVPLGVKGKFYAPMNNLDTTHQICFPHEWWVHFFRENRWKNIKFSFRVNGIKDKYYEKYPEAHGFFFMEKDNDNNTEG